MVQRSPNSPPVTHKLAPEGETRLVLGRAETGPFGIEIGMSAAIWPHAVCALREFTR